MAATLSEFAAKGKPRTPGPRVCWYKRLTPEQQEKVLAAKEGGFSHSVIASVVSSWSATITAAGVSIHFQGRCGCDRD